MAKLKPVFDRSAAGTLTAANSTPLTDGASCVLLASEDWAKARGLPVQARFVDYAVAAVDYVGMKGPREGLLMAPTYAVPQMLDRNGIRLQDFDIYEIHEAFAAQVLCTLKAWESEDYCRTKLGRKAPLGSIDRSKLNPVGSSVALGHPFAATGTRIVATLAKELEQRGGGRGLDLHLHRRRHGRHGDTGTLNRALILHVVRRREVFRPELGINLQGGKILQRSGVKRCAGFFALH